MMHAQTVDNYIIINQKYFPGDKILFLKEEDDDSNYVCRLNSKDSGSKQISFDFTEPVKEPNILKEEIDKIDPLNTTPMDALRILFDLKNKSKDIRE